MRGMNSVVLDSESDEEISGSSMMLLGDPARKRRLEVCNSSQESGASNSSKKPALQEDLVCEGTDPLVFQEASPVELSLISGCSVKKARRIVELRPFNEWENLVAVLDRGNGLSTDLVQGCCVVLREQDVARSLLTKCENITNKMMQDVTQVVERDKGFQKQPEILNSKFQLKPYQLIGQNWLTLLYQNNLSGILTDEMGLGEDHPGHLFSVFLLKQGTTKLRHIVKIPRYHGNRVNCTNARLSRLQSAISSFFIHNRRLYGSVEDRRFLRYDILHKWVDYNIIISRQVASAADVDPSAEQPPGAHVTAQLHHAQYVLQQHCTACQHVCHEIYRGAEQL
nr:SWI/SNF-related matrix-associated actin-dependent regulator of chromatin subfamily A containing DEAD/H box 1B-like [Salvelinus alpinus]